MEKVLDALWRLGISGGQRTGIGNGARVLAQACASLAVVWFQRRVSSFVLLGATS